MITGRHIADTALKSDLIGVPYERYDCQALVEVILKRAGLSIIDYRGSNHMWRDLVYNRTKMSDGVPPVGALCFIVKDDGGEVKRGYHDDMGNATHVAIVLSAKCTFESTTGGVQYGNLKRFTHWALIKDVDYSEGGETDEAQKALDKTKHTLLSLVDAVRCNIEELERIINEIYRNS